MANELEQFQQISQEIEQQRGLTVVEEINKGLAGCVVFRGVKPDGEKVVIKVGNSPRGVEEIESNLHGYRSIAEIGANDILPDGIELFETSFGPSIVMADLGTDFLITSTNYETTRANFDVLTATLQGVYSQVSVDSPELCLSSVNDGLQKLEDRIRKFPEVGINGYEQVADQIRHIVPSALSGRNSSLFLLDFTPSNVFIHKGKARFIDPWRQSTYLGNPLTSVAQFVTYAEAAYEVPGFNQDNLDYVGFMLEVGRMMGLTPEQAQAQFLIGQSLQYSLSAYYRIEKQPEKAQRFIDQMVINIDELRRLGEKNYSVPKMETKEVRTESGVRTCDTVSPEFWEKDFPQLVSLYQAAFGDYPWYLSLTSEYITDRLTKHFANNNCKVFVYEQDGSVVGASWFDQPSLGELATMRGAEISEFAANMLQEQGISEFIWMRETIVHPEMQKRGIGRKLRENIHTYMTDNFPNGVLVLTRHREDNEGIIRLSRENGFSPSGIVQTQMIDGKDVSNEFWYRLYK